MVVHYHRKWKEYVCTVTQDIDSIYLYVVGTNECVWMVPGTFDWEGNPIW